MNSMTIHLIRGLPDSGKSTLARKLCAEHDMDHWEADQFFETANGYVYIPDLIKEAHRSCKAGVAASLSSGRSVVVSNTFTRLWEMKDYYDLGAQYGANVLVSRMLGRYQNIHGVPDDVIARMAERWEH